MKALHAHSPRRTAAFTLLELMVALTVGGIAITSIYAVGASSTRVFHQQQQVANAQTALRMALDQVKRDLARAGYLGTANAGMAGQICGTVDSTLHTATTNPLAAISTFVNNRPINAGNQNTAVAPGAITVNAASGFTVDDVVLIGNYETASEYPGVTQFAPDTVAIGDGWHAFRRDFTNWYNPVPALGLDTDAFNRAFAVGRMIRLRLSNNLYHFARITQVVAPVPPATDDVRVSFSPPLPADCEAAVTGGTWIAPVSAIRYTVRDAAAVNQERFAQTTGPMAQLVREEVRPTDKTNALTDGGGNPISRRAILDYVVAFNMWFTMNSAAAGRGVVDSYTVGVTTDAALTVNNNPERVRSATVEIAVRTPEQDPTFLWSAAACANLRCYQVFADRPGAARVRRARAEVFIPNVANEGY